MNKTILALALSSLASPLFTPTTQSTMFSLSFNKLSLSYFFSSFVQSTSSSCNINIHNSDFGFFLSTVINLEAADHNINKQDMTTTYTGGSDGHMGWITCPKLTCQDSIFHDITATGNAAGAIAYQWTTEGTITGSTFSRIKQQSVGEAAALASREGNNSGGKAGKSTVKSSCFSHCVEEYDKKHHSFALNSANGVTVELTSVYQCGMVDGQDACAVRSSQSLVTVTNLNTSSCTAQNGKGSGITIKSSAQTFGTKLKQSNFFDNKGTVLNVDSDLNGNYQNYPVVISQCNFVSNNCLSNIGTKNPMINFMNRNSKVYLKITLEESVFIKNTNYDDMLQFNAYGRLGDVTITGNIGDVQLTIDLPGYVNGDSKYKVVANPAIKQNANLNTEACNYPNSGNDNDKDKKKLNSGQIAGIVVGTLAGVAVISVGVVFAIKKFRLPRTEAVSPQLPDIH